MSALYEIQKYMLDEFTAGRLPSMLYQDRIGEIFVIERARKFVDANLKKNWSGDALVIAEICCLIQNEFDFQQWRIARGECE